MQVKLKSSSLFLWKVDEYALELDFCWLILRQSPTKTSRSLILLLRVALATIHSEINSAFRKCVCDKTEGFIELFTFMSVIIYNKSARFLVSMSTKSSFSLTFDFLRKMFSELNFQRRPQKISQSQRTVLLPLTWNIYHSKHCLERCHAYCI